MNQFYKEKRTLSSSTRLELYAPTDVSRRPLASWAHSRRAIHFCSALSHNPEVRLQSTGLALLQAIDSTAGRSGGAVIFEFTSHWTIALVQKPVTSDGQLVRELPLLAPVPCHRSRRPTALPWSRERL